MRINSNMSGRNCRFLFSLLLLNCIFACKFSNNLVADDKYCGIYSVYGAAKLLNCEDVDFEILLSEKYVSSLEGSTGTDLLRALQDVGITGEFISDLGWPALANSDKPMILNVASEGQVDHMNHWCLVVSVDHNKAKVVWDEGGLVEMDTAMLLARWKGKAIVMGNSAAKSYRAELLFGLLVLAMGGTVFWAVPQFLAPQSVSTVKARTLASTAVFVVILVYSCNQPGALTWSSATNLYVAAAVETGKFPTVADDEMLQFVKDSSAIIIDVRPPEYYGQGCVDGARNIPYRLNTRALDDAVANISRDEKLVLYCKSSSCAFDDAMAMRFAALGFTDINLYQGGWEGWTALGSTATGTPQ